MSQCCNTIGLLLYIGWGGWWVGEWCQILQCRTFINFDLSLLGQAHGRAHTHTHTIPIENSTAGGHVHSGKARVPVH